MHRRLIPLVIALALVVGCDRAGTPDAARPPAPPPATTTGEPPTPTPAPTPSPPTELALPECFAAERAETRDVVLEGDVDGDGSADEVSVLVDLDGARECRAFLVVRGAGLWTAPLEVIDETALSAGLPVPSTLAEIDGTPGTEVVVTVHRGASTEFAALYTVAGDDLVRVRLRGTEDDLVPLWGSVAHMNGADCAPDGTLVTAAASSAGPHRYRVERVFYLVEGTELVPREVERTTVRSRNIDSVPELAGPPFLSCG